MKCPLITAGFFADPKTSEMDAIDCFEEECAWWNNTNDECAILQLSKSIYFMGVEVAQIQIKMPHLEQFKRP